MNKRLKTKILISLSLILALVGYAQQGFDTINKNIIDKNRTNEVLNINYENNEITINDETVPNWNGLSPYIELNGNKPFLLDEETINDVKNFPNYEVYAALDDLGRCGRAIAMVNIDIMPTEKRESIGMIKPSGWNQERYDDLISDKYLYNRCHLIGYQLAGENANELNLITGTRYLNVEGMLPFENRIAEYVKDTQDTVYYSVTPVFVNNELVARGVILEAQSVNSDEVSFNVFCYNVQPGIEINYKDGSSKRA